MEDQQALNDIIVSVLSAGGPWATLGAILMGALRLLRIPIVQQVLVAINPKFGWAAWPQWVKMALPFILALSASLISALVAGGGWTAALSGAILAGLSAITLHTGTKAAGSAIDNASVRRDSEYQPGPIRKAMSPVLPVDEKALAKKLMNSLEG